MGWKNTDYGVFNRGGPEPGGSHSCLEQLVTYTQPAALCQEDVLSFADVSSERQSFLFAVHMKAIGQLWFLPLPLSTLSFEPRSLTETGAHKFGQSGLPASPGTSPCSGITGSGCLGFGESNALEVEVILSSLVASLEYMRPCIKKEKKKDINR